MVNVANVENVVGNAQGYKLSLKGLKFQVPVSRSHLVEFNESLRKRRRFDSHHKNLVIGHIDEYT